MSSASGSEPPRSNGSRDDESSPRAPDATADKGATEESHAGESGERLEPSSTPPSSKVGAARPDDEPGNTNDPQSEPAERASRSGNDTAPEARQPNKPSGGQAAAPARSQTVIWVVVGIVIVAGILLVRSRKTGPPVDEQAYQQVASALEQRARPADAKKVRQKCSSASDCDCVITTAKLALDRDLHAEALRLIEPSTKACGNRVTGLRAEALARAGKLEAARKATASVLAQQPKDPYATYAMAQVAYAEGDNTKAKAQALAAVERGRGSAANLLLGLIAFNAGDMPGATDAFNKMLQDDPENVEAHYNLAVVAHRLNQYRSAREGYLKVLRLHPKHLDARYNLALLTHSAGAVPEAKHHLKKLREAAPPGDPRVARLEAAFSSAPPSSSGLTFTRGTIQAPSPRASAR